MKEMTEKYSPKKNMMSKLKYGKKINKNSKNSRQVNHTKKKQL